MQLTFTCVDKVLQAWAMTWQLRVVSPASCIVQIPSLTSVLVCWMMCSCCTNHSWWVTKNANGRLVVWWRFQYGCLVDWWRCKMAANDVSDDARWCRQRHVESLLLSYVALYLCTTRCTWALSRRVLSEDTHSWQWETLKWENRMLGPRHRCCNLTSWCVVVSAVCWCHR